MTKEEKQKRREEIIFEKKLEEKDYLGGLASFNDLSVSKLEQLLSEELAKQDECQNEAPSIKDLLDFGKKWEEYDIRFQGYTIHSARGDHRVSLDGICIRSDDESFSAQFVIDFTNNFRCADEFELNTHLARAWFD